MFSVENKYTYDSAYRVTNVAFGDGRPDTRYQIDGVGNWGSRTEGGETTQWNSRSNGVYAADVMNEIFRQATFDPVGALISEEQHTQDANGNRIASGEYRLVFDLFDRLVRAERVSDGVTVGRYRYDAGGRRVERTFENPATGSIEQVFYVCDGAQEIEELGPSGNLVADYVWGSQYIDQLVQMRRDRGAGLEVFYAHSNSIFTVHALTDASGQVVERYCYTSIYGEHPVLDGAGGARAPPQEIGNPWRFQGRRLDPETGLLLFRLRYLDPALGRFVSRDPLGAWGDPGNLGNGYAFCQSDPINCVDPMGTEGELEFFKGEMAGLTSAAWNAVKEVAGFLYDVESAAIGQVHDLFACESNQWMEAWTPTSSLGLAVSADQGSEAVLSIVTEFPDRIAQASQRTGQLTLQGRHYEAGHAFGEGVLFETTITLEIARSFSGRPVSRAEAAAEGSALESGGARAARTGTESGQSAGALRQGELSSRPHRAMSDLTTKLDDALRRRGDPEARITDCHKESAYMARRGAEGTIYEIRGYFPENSPLAGKSAATRFPTRGAASSDWFYHRVFVSKGGFYPGGTVWDPYIGYPIPWEAYMTQVRLLNPGTRIKVTPVGK